MARLGRAQRVQVRSSKPWIYLEHTTANAGIALGNGLAVAPGIALAPSAGNSSGAGAALVASAQLTVNVGMASGSGEAPDATVLTGPTLVATAGIALGSGAAQGEKTPQRLLALGSGLAIKPDVAIAAQGSVTTGTGTAASPAIQITPTLPFIVGSGSALTARAQETLAVPLLSASGSSPSPALILLPQPPVASGSGSAPASIPQIAISVPLISGTGSAQNPSVTLVENPLGRFHVMANNAANAPVNILAMGDSLTEGLNPDTSSSGFIDDRWIEQLTTTLRGNYGAGVGGVGFVNILNNCANGSTAGTAYWVLGGGGSADIADARAFAHQTYNTAINEVVTLHYTGTSFKLQYTLGSSAFTVAVDGGSPVTVTPGAGSTYQGWYTSPILSYATHTAVITPTAGQRAKVHGAFVYGGDETKGFHLWDNGQSGLLGVGESGYVPTDQLATGACVNPALVLLSFGTNDYGSHIDTATFVTAMQTIISTVNGLCSIHPSWALIAPHERGDGSGSPTWAQYITAFQTVTGVTFIDMSALMVKPTNGNGHSGGKCTTDNVHLTSTGNIFWASSIDTALL